MTKLLLAMLYPFVLLSRAGNAVLGRDPLRLSKAAPATYWIERPAVPSDRSYFDEASAAEGHAHGGLGVLAAAVLAAVARWYVPPRAESQEKFSAAADREQGIPDEMYTLW